MQNTSVCRDTDTVSQELGIWVAGNRRITIRDCRFWDFKQQIAICQQHGRRDVGQVDVTIYRNKFHVPQGGTPVHAREVVGYEFLDNEVMSLGSASSDVLTTARFAWLAEIAARFERNHYYAPSRPGGIGIFADLATYPPSQNTTQQTFAQWQAAGRDLDADFSPLAWIDPANGDFRTTAIPVPTVTYVVTGPPSLVVGVAQTYTITPSGDATGIRVIPALTPAANGVITTMPPAFSGSAPVTFRVTITAPASFTLSTTNDGGLANPAPLVYEVQPTPTDPLPDPPPATTTRKPPKVLPSQIFSASSALLRPKVRGGWR